MKKLHLIGNAHLDAAWIWPWQEGFGEVKATFLSALNRLNEFDDILFTSSSAQYYEWIENNEPDMFKQIAKRVQEGRWVLCGGWWVQPDCNIPCGESFVRQGLFGQNYFKEKFGRTATVGYNVDSFGHNGALPQILSGSGMDAYVFLRPGPHEKNLPGEAFEWIGQDGSKVTAFRITESYCNGLDLQSHLENCMAAVDDTCSSSMCFFGVGNHGGGPTIENITYLKEQQAKHTDIDIAFSSPDAFFEELRAKGVSLPVYKGELQHHSVGCYSVNAEIKNWNRQAENALLKAEKYSVVGKMLGVPNYCDLKQAWKQVLFNQFHDILAGVCIPEVYQDALAQLGEAVSLAGKAENHALQGISFHIDIPFQPDTQPLVVFNPHSWTVTSVIEHEKGLWGNFSFPKNCKVVNSMGEEVPCQFIHTKAQLDKRKRIAFLATVPAMGYETYRIVPDDAKWTEDPFVNKNAYVFENQYTKVVFNEYSGYISSIYDKQNEVELLNGCANVPLVINDLSDTWGHTVEKYDEVIGQFKLKSIAKIEEGALLSRIRVTYTYEKSVLTQVFTLYRNNSDIFVHSTVHWQEQFKCLKIQFALNLANPVATYENPFGHIVREADGMEEPIQSWLDVTGEDPVTRRPYGMGLLNNNKYGADISNARIRLTILRSPVYAHHYPNQLESDNGNYLFTDQGRHSFTYVLVPHCSDWRSAHILQKAMVLNQPPTKVVETFHKGTHAQCMGTVFIKDENIILSTLKKAHNSDHYILRAYEAYGKKTETAIEMPLLNRSIHAVFEPYQIKTFSISTNDSEPVQETNLIELPIESSN